jgi:hypothetical protein
MVYGLWFMVKVLWFMVYGVGSRVAHKHMLVSHLALPTSTSPHEATLRDQKAHTPYGRALGPA